MQTLPLCYIIFAHAALEVWLQFSHVLLVVIINGLTFYKCLWVYLCVAHISLGLGLCKICISTITRTRICICVPSFRCSRGPR